MWRNVQQLRGALVSALALSLIQVPQAFAGPGDSYLWTASLRPVLAARPATIADVLDPYRTTATLLEQCGKFPLNLAPEQTNISAGDLVRTLGARGIDPAHLIVQGATLTLPALDTSNLVVQQITQAFTQRVAEQMHTPANLVDVEIGDGAAAFPKAGTFDSVEATLDTAAREGTTMNGNATFRMHSGAVLSQTAVAYTFRLSPQVVVAAHAIPSGATLTAKDCTVERRPGSAIGADAIRDVAELGEQSWIAIGALNAGQIVTTAQLQRSTHLQKGSLVTLTARSDHFQVRASGRIKEVMDNGASVLVENLDSKKELIGKPVSDSEVQIVY